MTPDTLRAAFDRVHTARPLIQMISNIVTVNATANAVLAFGASPVVIENAEEMADIVPVAGAACLNIGTISGPFIPALMACAFECERTHTPWVLDPVGAGALPRRTTLSEILIRHKPTVIRGNGSEILALAGQASQGKGVDAGQEAEDALIGAARSLASATGAVVAATGATDIISDGTTTILLRHGSPLLPLITGTGCMVSAVTAAALGGGGSALEQTVLALGRFALASEVAAKTAQGPGTLAASLFDALHAQTADGVAADLRVETA